MRAEERGTGQRGSRKVAGTCRVLLSAAAASVGRGRSGGYGRPKPVRFQDALLASSARSSQASKREQIMGAAGARSHAYCTLKPWDLAYFVMSLSRSSIT